MRRECGRVCRACEGFFWGAAKAFRERGTIQPREPAAGAWQARSESNESIWLVVAEFLECDLPGWHFWLVVCGGVA